MSHATGMSMWRIVDCLGTAHLRYGGWDQTHANDFDAEQRSTEFKSIWRRLISDFRQILLCWHREDDEFSVLRRSKAECQGQNDSNDGQEWRQGQGQGNQQGLSKCSITIFRGRIFQGRIWQGQRLQQGK